MKRILSLFLLVVIAHVSWAQDEIDLKPNQRMVAIGDIHGDPEVLAIILKGMDLVDERLNWIAGDTHVVFTGDLVSKGRDSRSVLDFVMRLQKEAERTGGGVHSILGNHEFYLSSGDLDDVHKDDLKNFPDFRKTPRSSDKKAFRRAFRKNSPYAVWIRKLPAILRINQTLFVHGGLTEAMVGTSFQDINRSLANEVAYVQGLTDEPRREIDWRDPVKGPFRTRSFSPEKRYEEYRRLNSNQLESLLSSWGVDQVIVGHNVIEPEIMLFHPIYGDKVLMIDTGNSEIMENGEITAIEIVDTAVTSFGFERRTGQRKFLKGRKLGLSGCESHLK